MAAIDSDQQQQQQLSGWRLCELFCDLRKCDTIKRAERMLVASLARL